MMAKIDFWLRFRNDRWPINIQNSNSILFFLVLPVLDTKTMTISDERTVFEYSIAHHSDIYFALILRFEGYFWF